MKSTIISVGSNIDPHENCETSMRILQAETNFRARSEFILTKPWGHEIQADFLNGAYWLETELDYASFNAYLKQVEKRMDRIDHGDKTGPRTIDLDIIVWDNVIIDEDFYNRDYVRIPVTELIENHCLKIKGYPEPDI